MRDKIETAFIYGFLGLLWAFATYIWTLEMGGLL